ncbi:MAG TPA: efflux RND transporter periplasmic adaptor subunit [Lacipirellulaceae bacterium]|nr:efflux RND transporter periplasmic adaptor subunit [Lacipirellulaceae bacterium]
MLRFLFGIIIIACVGAAAYGPASNYFSRRNHTQWRTAKVVRGRIVADVTSIGTIQPVLKVLIGSFVSGPITELHADFNQVVKKGDLLARIDPRLYQANVDQSQAMLATRKADVDRAKALLQQARRDEQRAIALREEDENFISGKEMDALHFNRLALEAQLKLAEAAVDEAQGGLANAKANLEYTKILSPVDGMVIDRKIDRGQTLAAQFQTPELFIIAPDMEKKMHVFASVDEADIGFIMKAQERGLPVEFRVDAYRGEIFYGEIEQIRKNSTTTENVVTYPVVVAAANPDLKLLPGMTARLSFQVDERKDVVCVPNSALRFYPDAKQVRPEDREILLGKLDSDEPDIAVTHQSAEDRAAALEKENRRHVWVEDGQFLRAVPVVTGLTDLKYSELISGELSEGDVLVTGIKPPEFSK